MDVRLFMQASAVEVDSGQWTVDWHADHQVVSQPVNGSEFIMQHIDTSTYRLARRLNPSQC